MVARIRDLDPDDFQAVVGHEPGCRFFHVVQQMLLQASLVDDDVRHFRQLAGGVVDAAGARDAGTVLRVGAPEDRLVDPAGFAQQGRGKSEGVEHFDRAGSDAVRVAQFERARASFDDAGGEPGKGRELRGQHQAGRAGADDQHVDGIGQGFGRMCKAGGRRLGFGIAELVAIEVVLHGRISEDEESLDD